MKDLEKANFDLDKSIDAGYLRGKTAIDMNKNSLDSARMKVGLLAEKESFEDGSFDDPHYLDKYLRPTSKHLDDGDSSIASLDISKIKEEIIAGNKISMVVASQLTHNIIFFLISINYIFHIVKQQHKHDVPLSDSQSNPYVYFSIVILKSQSRPNHVSVTLVDINSNLIILLNKSLHLM